MPAWRRSARATARVARRSDSGVFFMALGHLFQYQPLTHETHLWRYPQHYGTVVEDHGQVLVQFREQGLKRQCERAAKRERGERVGGVVQSRELHFSYSEERV